MDKEFAGKEWEQIQSAIKAEVTARADTLPSLKVDTSNANGYYPTKIVKTIPRRRMNSIRIAAVLILCFALGILALSLRNTDSRVDTVILQSGQNDSSSLEQYRFGRGYINQVKWSPVEDHFALGGTLGVWLYDANDLDAEPRLLPAESTHIEAIDFSPDGNLIAGVEDGGLLHVWDIETGEEVFSLEVVHPAVAFSPDSAHIALFNQNQIEIYALETGEVTQHTEFRPTSLITDMVYRADGQQIYLHQFSSRQSYLFAWDLDSVNTPTQVSELALSLIEKTFSPDGHYLYWRSWESRSDIQVIETETGEVITSWFPDLEYSGAGRILETDPTGRYVIAVYDSGRYLIWNTQTNESVKELNIYPNMADAQKLGLVWHMALNVDATQLVIAFETGAVQLWDLTSSDENYSIHEIEEHRNLGRALWYEQEPVHIAFSPDSEHVAVGSEGLGVQELDVRTGELGTLYEFAGSTLRSVVYDGDQLIAGADANRRFVFAMGMRSAEIKQRGGYLLAWDQGDRQTTYAAWYYDDSIVVVVSAPNRIFIAPYSVTPSGNGGIQVIDIETRFRSGTRMTNAFITNLVHDPNHNQLAGSSYRGVTLWQLDEEGTDPFWLTADNAGIRDAVFSPDGNDVAAVTDRNLMVIWNIATKEQVAQWQSESPLMALAYSPDGSLIAVVGLDQSLMIWDVEQQTSIVSLDGHVQGAAGVAFSPDGSLIATAGFDGTVRIWSVDNILSLDDN